jgi:chromate reductase
MKNNILIINASIRGQEGNSYAIALAAKNYIENTQSVNVEIYDLAHPKNTIREVFILLENADAFIIISGTYWNNISSTLQRFIEVCTPFENTNAFFGKPVSTIISMDSVGGIEVANKIISPFSGLGCWTPPCSTIILSRLGEEAVKLTQDLEDDPNEDVWRLEDIEILIDNLIIASQIEKKKWRVWPNIQLHLEDGQWPSSGDLNMDTPKFI